MTALQLRNGSYRVLFQYEGRQETLTIGRINSTEANHWKARTESLLLRIKQRLLHVPTGVSITDFVLHDGRPPVESAPIVAKTTLHELREAYLKTHGNGAIETSTLDTARIHLAHAEVHESQALRIDRLRQGGIDRGDGCGVPVRTCGDQPAADRETRRPTSTDGFARSRATGN